MRTKYPCHLSGFSYLGRHAYSLTFCTEQRHRAFEASQNVAAAWEQILRAGQQEDMEVLAYCFMPDHLHLVTLRDLLEFACVYRSG